MNSRRLPAGTRVLLAVVAVGLLIDVVVHVDMASAFADHHTSAMSETTLFRIESILAIIAAAGVWFRPRRYTVGFAFIIAASAFVLAIIYRYVDVGAIGPIPNLYDPYWGPPGKIITMIGELVAALAALVLWPKMGRAQQRARRR